ncbi:hypothetical protein Ais01nite_06890 [Asanoa ishikariensis]|uniref:Lipoprotein n=1 Tax=Asanoa ishikariensis TaxID=137265 RepID=A0A1H3TER6_9ACTN|nr:hypothetical protein [Asanoa ishikariensis]GIF62654.1 hypothetical protein Ais01nite_06890 [Asanoa ishikariensis]SDZ48165.1 hypothetical protein SAMN05421684_5546 [Asanoa ishikariensis]
MRRGIATVFVVGLVGLGAAACGSGDDAGGSAASSGSGEVKAEDKSVVTSSACDEAIADSEARLQDLAAALEKLGEGGSEGEAAAPAEKTVDDTLQWWGYQLDLLANQDIDSDVKTAIADAAKTISKLSKTPLEQSMPTLEGIPTSLKNVCV